MNEFIRKKAHGGRHLLFLVSNGNTVTVPYHMLINPRFSPLSLSG